MSEKPLYYADSCLVRKRAQSRPIPGGQIVSIGFPVCRATDYVGAEGAATIAALLCLGEGAQVTFQARVQPWMMACFGPEVSGDREERNHRFLEEALELVQSYGCTASEAHQLVDYTFARDVGESSQETGGVMVTLAALCLANGLDMHEAAEVELARIWTKVETIRAKQAAKPKYSPLPAHVETGNLGKSDAIAVAETYILSCLGDAEALGKSPAYLRSFVQGGFSRLREALSRRALTPPTTSAAAGGTDDGRGQS